MQRSRINSRKIKTFFTNISNNIKFKIESFSFAKIVILVWVLLWYISLFMRWINSENKVFISNIFNNITYISSIIFIISLSIVLFLLFSINKKEKIKKSTSIVFRDYIIIIFISIVIFILAINNLWVIIWLQTFSSEVYYWNWVITMITSAVFIFTWWFLLKNEHYSWDNIYLNDSKEQKSENSEVNNTKLPF
jgi:hypothetical protein